MIDRLNHVAVSIMCLMLLTGCFTGIESTPKITLDDVKQQKVVVTPEQEFLSKVSQQQFGCWESGKEFYVTDNKINLIFGASATSLDSLAGKVIKYNQSNVVTSMTGDTIVELVFCDQSGRKFIYRTGITLAEITQRKSVEVPFTIEKSLIDAVREKVAGKECYVLTSVWYDKNDDVSYRQKFVPVTITDAQPGNHVYPVKLSFIDGKGDVYYMFVNMSENSKAPRSFSTLFSFTNPHQRYSNINDDMWAAIVNGRVVEGMTRDECRLSLGSPASINRQPGYSGVSELWLYDNGTYLKFQDGVLQDYRVPSARK